MCPRAALARLAAVAVAALAGSCGEPEPRVVRIFAASSLREACEELEEVWEERRPDVDLVFNFAASSFLAEQILASRRADLFLSADRAQLERVRESGLVVADGPEGWLSNQLVVVVPASSDVAELEGARDLADPRFRRLSIGNPDSVPAGRYAKAWLEEERAWESVRERVVPGIDVRAALAAVESAACEAGIVYATDAAITARARIVLRVPPGTGPRIEYGIASLAGPGGRDDATLALEHFRGPDAARIFSELGFVFGAP